MTKRGRKPTPARLKLVTSNPGNRPFTADPAEDVTPDHDNGLEPPRKLSKRKQEIWDRYIKPCPWLSHLDETTAWQWLELYYEFERGPAKMVASRIAQMRALASELGLNPSSRARLDSGGEGNKRKKDDPAARYF